MDSIIEAIKIFIKEIETIAKLDLDRFERIGKPEAILAECKENEDLIKIIDGYLSDGKAVLVTRLREDQIRLLKDKYDEIRINHKAKTAIIGKFDREIIGKVAIFTAGTSDIAVAEEASETAIFLGLEPLKFYDIGIAGIHRLFEPLKKAINENVIAIIAIAGMEGALPSVIASMVDIPVIAVPTSVGYGTSFSGLTALFSMLQSCSSGVAVVNIDNGFGAAVFSYLIARNLRKILNKAKEKD